jgi:polyhydroxyalkanoate synthesis regulator phasin
MIQAQSVSHEHLSSVVRELSIQIGMLTAEKTSALLRAQELMNEKMQLESRIQELENQIKELENKKSAK